MIYYTKKAENAGKKLHPSVVFIPCYSSVVLFKVWGLAAVEEVVCMLWDPLESGGDPLPWK